MGRIFNSLSIASAILCGFSGAAQSQQPLEVVAALSRAFSGAGQALDQDQMEVASELSTASQHVARSVEASPMEEDLIDIMTRLELSMSGMSEAVSAGDTERLMSEAITYRIAMGEFAEGIGGEVGLAYRENPAIARELGLEGLTPALYESIGAADALLDELGAAGDATDAEEATATAFRKIGSSWSQAGASMEAWADGGAGIGNPWGDTCTCGETRGNSICVVDKHLLCNTCEWHDRTD